MIYGFLSLLTTTSIFAFSIVGTITIINKAGHFLKTMEEEKKDSYKKAFDKFMIETIEEINFSVDSLKLITKHTFKNSKLFFDLVSGNKCIKKDKDGNIIVSDKSKLTEEYKEKIEHLYTKLKKYENEVKKYKSNEMPEKEKLNDGISNKKSKENDKSGENSKLGENDKKTDDVSDDTISDDDSGNETDELEYYLESDK
jgi:hypothetical protein